MKTNSWQDWQRFKKGKKGLAKKWKLCLNLPWVIRKQIRKHCCILSGTWLTTFRLKNFSSSKAFFVEKVKARHRRSSSCILGIMEHDSFFSHVTVCENYLKKSPFMIHKKKNSAFIYDETFQSWFSSWELRYLSP